MVTFGVSSSLLLPISALESLRVKVKALEGVEVGRISTWVQDALPWNVPGNPLILLSNTVAGRLGSDKRAEPLYQSRSAGSYRPSLETLEVTELAM
ncbi:uncharacterized protein VTP21DRAFT_902 [Calcarisporiella thermophila]|uniref:uncharacterized protein n=1 Tax=Calcarisporiella thermophila TaxID=911321 RepID=UPI003744B218